MRDFVKGFESGFDVFLTKNSADMISNAVNVGENGGNLMTVGFWGLFRNSWMTVPVYDFLYVAGAISILKKSCFDVFQLLVDIIGLGN